MENRLPHNTTLLNVAGAFYNAESDVLVRNVSWFHKLWILYSLLMRFSRAFSSAQWPTMWS